MKKTPQKTENKTLSIFRKKTAPVGRLALSCFVPRSINSEKGTVQSKGIPDAGILNNLRNYTQFNLVYNAMLSYFSPRKKLRLWQNY